MHPQILNRGKLCGAVSQFLPACSSTFVHGLSPAKEGKRTCFSERQAAVIGKIHA